MKTAKEGLAELEQLTSARVNRRRNFPNLISRIRFPVFKNLEANAEINFKHPFTVFVGQNGCGKSSALQALSGAPRNYSVGNLWFSTELDPITEGPGRPNCFIYTYYNREAAKDVEIIKTRVKYNKSTDGGARRKVNFENWEPKRGDLRYGMVLPVVTNGVPEPGSERSKRWKLPTIEVLYMDFRSELSAFDQYFYFGEKPVGMKRYNSKQDRLRAWVRNKLAPLLLSKTPFVENRKKEKLNKKPVYDVSQDELDAISSILGKAYVSCKMVQHSIFGGLGYSILFQAENLRYSEAFAGSGEMAVVRLVCSVKAAKENSLILLDEPEVSLHPGAQKKLRDFLLEEAASRGHQIVLCTHSPVFLEELPKKCIKVFLPNGDGSFRIVEDVNRNDAFVRMGHTIHDRRQIVVEDSAAHLLVLKAIEEIDPELLGAIDVRFSPGGETAIFKDLVVYAHNNDLNRYVIFDGDIFHAEWPEEDSISDAQLDKTILRYCGQHSEKLGFRFDGGTGADNLQNKIAIKRAYFKYISERCHFLPTDTPEELVWNAVTLENKEDYEQDVDVRASSRFKDYIGNYANDQFGEDNSEARRLGMKSLLKNHFDVSHPQFLQLVRVVRIIQDAHAI